MEPTPDRRFCRDSRDSRDPYGVALSRHGKSRWADFKNGGDMNAETQSCKTTTSIGEVRIRPVANGSDGLIAFASCRYGDVLLNDVAIRRDDAGKLYLTYPRKRSSTGRPHPLHHPLDRDTAAQFEEAILGQLRKLVGSGS